MVFEDLAGEGRRGDNDAELVAEVELEDWAVGLGQGGEVGVELRIQIQEVAQQGQGPWARGEAGVAAGLGGDELEEEDEREEEDTGESVKRGSEGVVFLLQ